MAFDPLPQAYDLLAAHPRRLAAESPFLLQWAADARSILDIACGTGVHAWALVEHGPDDRVVTGLDLDDALLSFARQHRDHPRVRWVRGDMRVPPAGPFERLLLIGNSLNLLPDAPAVHQTLAALRRTCAAGGRLLIQVLDPDDPAQQPPRHLTRHDLASGLHIMKSLVPVAGRRFVDLVVRQRDENDTWQHSHSGQVLLDLTRDALLAALAGTGWRVLDSWASLRDGGSGDIVLDAVPDDRPAA